MSSPFTGDGVVLTSPPPPRIVHHLPRGGNSDLEYPDRELHHKGNGKLINGLCPSLPDVQNSSFGLRANLERHIESPIIVSRIK